MAPVETAPAELPADAYLAALAGLAGMGPSRLLGATLVLSPAEAWARVLDGSIVEVPGMAERMAPNPRDIAQSWQIAARATDLAASWAAHAGVTVAARGDARYPAALATDLEPPAVVFMAGDPKALDGPSVAIVGTRRCTRYGLDVAHELGRDLSAAGIHVVSGLALGIDGAAHEGALAAWEAGGAAPVGVVASGLDVPYPRRHAPLWRRVQTAGLVLSEAPLGMSPEAWRFPARNRIIAALSLAVIVVESAGKGGSMHTVTSAMERSLPVLCVPGSVRSPASAGTNELIYDGAQMVRDVRDVLIAIGHAGAKPASRERRPAPDAEGRAVLRAMAWEPASFETLAIRSGFEFGRLSLVLTQLELDGWVERNGPWFERVAAPR